MHINDNEAMRLQKSWVRLALSGKWLGQTFASVFWLGSIFAYGINSTGDVLQLCAASAWLTANIATLVSEKAS